MTDGAPLPRRIIASTSDLAQGMCVLAGIDPAWARLIARTGVPRLRRREGGFAGLASIIVGQQVSVASAQAIWARTGAVLGEITASRLLLASDEELRQCGLSRPKQRTLRAIATAVAGGGLDLAALEYTDADTVRERLMAISGIGPWTADIYSLFCLGHADSFASGDLALQEAARHAFDLPARPAAGTLDALAEPWRPWRGVAAHLLWEYYAIMKGREGSIGSSE